MMNTLKVLVVDDEPGMRMGVCRSLQNHTIELPDIDEKFDIQAEAAETAEQALEIISERQPDILLLDHKLPGMSGLDVLERLNVREDGMVTVMITAYASLDTAVTAIKRGAFDFLAKPFTPSELKSTVNKAAQSLILARHVRKLKEEKRQVRFQFISVLGHELKAPLNAVEGYMQILKDKNILDDTKNYEKMIDRCLVRTEQMRKLIVDLLEMTKIESGQRKRELTSIDLKNIAEIAVETVEPEALKRGIGIELDVEGDSSFNGDRSEIEIVMNNLISNAIKYNRDGGKVYIGLQARNGSRILSVRDTGIGMTDDEAKKLFNDFVRIKNEKTRNILGSGLGLSIVQKIAQLYNGSVSVTSKPDEGSTFTVLLNPPPEENEE